MILYEYLIPPMQWKSSRENPIFGAHAEEARNNRFVTGPMEAPPLRPLNMTRRSQRRFFSVAVKRHYLSHCATALISNSSSGRIISILFSFFYSRSFSIFYLMLLNGFANKFFNRRHLIRLFYGNSNPRQLRRLKQLISSDAVS